MCRLLAVKSERPFAISKHLLPFATIARNCKEYQGHGWGCAFLSDGRWKIYKNINPVWEDDFNQFGATDLLLAHARSAFHNEGIAIENNMPFYDETYVFIFNGELRGVTIKETGRIGAEKTFNYVKRFDKGDMLEAMKRGIGIINKRTRYIRAMNIILADTRKRIYVATQFNEDPDYFQMSCKRLPGMKIICSEPYADDEGWEKLDGNTIMEF